MKLKKKNLEPAFKSCRDGMGSLALFFGLSLTEAEMIFHPDSYDDWGVTLKTVTDRIRAVVAGTIPLFEDTFSR